VYRDHTIAVVVPAFNEELLITETLSSIPLFVDRIYVVNDGSTDRTLIIIDEISQCDTRVIPIHHNQKMGVGAAITSGYKHSVKDNMDIVVVIDGDNQMDSQIMPSMIDPIIQNRADYTKGNRLLSPEYRRGMSTWRFIGNTLLTIMTKFSSGYWNLMDPQNGYTAISYRALERINLDRIYPQYGYLNDLLVKLNVFGFRVMNIEMPARYGRETSKIRYARYIRTVSFVLIRDFFYRLKMKYIILSFHPLVIFYLFGFLMVLMGIIAGIFTAYWVFFANGALFVRGVLSLLIFAIGLQFLSFALLFDIQESRGLSRMEWDDK
jgi:glycosyltransferase involved in cell wall biosynthesis